ncbi:MAG: histidine phosphatase family protein [Candidatus Promineifilaceae bacterium]
MSNPKTTILLIRHGETDWNAAGRWQGHSDIPLNENGRQQAQALAYKLAGWPIQAIYSSDLKRAKETADIIATPHQLNLILDTDLRERHGGYFQGLVGTEIRTKYAREWKMLIEGHDVEGVESNIALQERVWRAFEKIAATHQGEMVAVVSHGGSLGLLIAKALGFTLGQRPRFTMRHNTGLSIVEIGENGPLVTLLNDGSHLSNL